MLKIWLFIRSHDSGQGRLILREFFTHTVYSFYVWIIKKKTLAHTVTHELTGLKEENRRLQAIIFIFIGNTCRVYRDGEVLIFSLCFSPLGLLSHAQPWGISPCYSPVDELSLSEEIFCVCVCVCACFIYWKSLQ